MFSMQFIPAAEAAYIGGVTEHQMNGVADAHLVPTACVKRAEDGWLFNRLGAALASVHFSVETELDADERRYVVDQLFGRVVQLPEEERGLTVAALEQVDWKVECRSLVLDALPYVRTVLERVKEVDQAHALVTTDPQTMGGPAVFAGTRVPLDFVLSSLAQGAAFERLKNAYSFLTVEHIQAARVYEAIHPGRSRPRRLSEVNPGLPHRMLRFINRMDAG